MIKYLVKILVILMLSLPFCLTAKQNGSEINTLSKAETDTFTYRKIKITNPIFSKALTALKDSLFENLNCDQFDYIRVLFKDSGNIIGLVPKHITQLSFDFALADSHNNSSKKKDSIATYLLFEVDNIIFQTQSVVLEKIGIQYELLPQKFKFNTKEFKPIKSKRCKKCHRKDYLKQRPFLTFKIIENNNLNILDFKTKEKTVLGVTWHDL